MNKYVIVDGQPYLMANGKTYAVRRNSEGFTVGAEVKLASVPTRTYSELSILAKYQDGYDSIGNEPIPAKEEVEEPAEEQGEIEDTIIPRDGEDLIIPEEVSDAKEEIELEKATVPELRTYAKQQGIELNGARSKADIIKAITK